MEFDSIFDASPYSPEFRTSPIYQAVLQHDVAKLLPLMPHDVNYVDSVTNCTYLHLVCHQSNAQNEKQMTPFIYCLSNYHCDVNAQDTAGRSALHVAIQKGLCRIMTALLRCGATHNESACRASIAALHNTTDRDQLLCHYEAFSPDLWSAVRDNDYLTVSRLLSHWCRVKITRQSQSLCAYARRVSASSLIIEALESKRSSMEFVHAALCGDERRMLEVLNNKNVDSCLYDHSACFIARALAAKRPQSSSTSQLEKKSNALMAPIPKSLRQVVIEAGFENVLYLLPDPRKQRHNKHLPAHPRSNQSWSSETSRLNLYQSASSMSEESGLSLSNVMVRGSPSVVVQGQQQHSNYNSKVCSII